ncbi:MAG: hypothetical protein HF976_14095 [ANME-2 cluster archaeon]|nr:hypothetical protein [ANME-2 cluster archaeon]MBC2702506.1 hypothetical protein [ANME-2 cluster archaeon]MBC2706550.1 hypothetical protein [ANME-2 cluster archaeon]MBC2747050.1 hypothetical protein [ANME-2 cluster archaeon]
MNINTTLRKFIENSNYFNNRLNREVIEFIDESNIDCKYKKAQKLIEQLVEPHRKNQLYRHITELYEVEVATMSLTGKRDHVLHSVNTFLLGLFINDKYLDKKVDMFQWNISALFHDIAYPLEISQKIIERYFNKLNSIKCELDVENFTPNLNIVPKDFEKLTNNKNSFEYIQKRVYKWGLDINVQKRYADMIFSNQICHGIISALTVLYLIDLMYQSNNPERNNNNNNHSGWEQRYFENDVVSACSAIFLHNLSDDAFKNIKKNKAPLPYLLKLCDELQNWDRPKTDMLNGDSPENYDVFIHDNKLIYKVGSESIKYEILHKIECLNDRNVVIKNETQQ